MRNSILVIDDDEPMRRSLELLLAIKGYSVATAQDGRDGIDRFDARRPALVITDLVMPEHGGIEAIAHIKQRDPHVKVIAMSGDGSARAYLRIASEMGADACLEKPFECDELLGLVERYLPLPGSAAVGEAV